MKIINICGARPNFMKIASVMRAYETVGGFTPLLVHTGQHYDARMSRSFFDELEIPRPDINLEVGSGAGLGASLHEHPDLGGVAQNSRMALLTEQQDTAQPTRLTRFSTVVHLTSIGHHSGPLEAPQIAW